MKPTTGEKIKLSTKAHPLPSLLLAPYLETKNVNIIQTIMPILLLFKLFILRIIFKYIRK